MLTSESWETTSRARRPMPKSLSSVRVTAEGCPDLAEDGAQAGHGERDVDLVVGMVGVPPLASGVP